MLCKTIMSLSKLGQEYATSEGSEEGECSSSDEGNTVRMFSSNQKKSYTLLRHF